MMWTLISQGPITAQPWLLIWPHIGSQEAFQALPRAGPSWYATWKVVFLWFSLNKENEAQREKTANCAGRGEVRIHPSRSPLILPSLLLGLILRPLFLSSFWRLCCIPLAKPHSPGSVSPQWPCSYPLIQPLCPEWCTVVHQPLLCLRIRWGHK